MYIDKLMNANFLEYASYVIKDRAIPHINDGLKPVQRRILHSLIELDDGKFHKVANVVGHCMKYHPHGDASIASALVVLANKELFIDKQGNFGNIITGDEASAARYIECRILPFTKEILYRPKLTEYINSYDGRNKEPLTFPATVPLILIMGAEGIAVGMATKILPHNFGEIITAMKASLRGEHIVLYPDFPSGGFMDASQYADGMGKVLVRAKFDIVDQKRIVIREIPFGSTTESLIASIETAVKKGKIKIVSIQDYTTDAVEIELLLARGVYPEDVLTTLYAFTDCELSISVNLLLIKDDKPVQMTVSQVIAHHSMQLLSILEQELLLEQQEVYEKIFTRTIEQIFIENRLYKNIEELTSKQAIMKTLFESLQVYTAKLQREITNNDIERLLQIPIRRISLYDIKKVQKELREFARRLKEIDYHLQHLIAYASNYLDTIYETQKEHSIRKTQLVSFTQIQQKEVAIRSISIHYDSKNLYVGSEVKATELCKVSEFDRILMIYGNGNYIITKPPKKLFVEKLLHCMLADAHELSLVVYTIVYIHENGYPYIKRCTIEKFIAEKEYALIDTNAKLLALSIMTEGMITIKYAAKRGEIRVEEVFMLHNYSVKSVSSVGVRLSKTYNARSVKITKIKK